VLPSPDLEGLGLPNLCDGATCGFTHVRPADSLYAGDPADAWDVSFNDGDVIFVVKDAGFYVRCVRAGP